MIADLDAAFRKSRDQIIHPPMILAIRSTAVLIATPDATSK